MALKKNQVMDRYHYRYIAAVMTVQITKLSSYLYNGVTVMGG